MSVKRAGKLESDEDIDGTEAIKNIIGVRDFKD
jgi:hypothetical protein